MDFLGGGKEFASHGMDDSGGGWKRTKNHEFLFFLECTLSTGLRYTSLLRFFSFQPCFLLLAKKFAWHTHVAGPAIALDIDTLPRNASRASIFVPPIPLPKSLQHGVSFFVSFFLSFPFFFCLFHYLSLNHFSGVGKKQRTRDWNGRPGFTLLTEAF